MDTRVVKDAAAEPSDLALILRMVRDYLGPRKLTLFFAVLCMMGGAATTAALAWLLDPAIKLIFIDKRMDMLLLIPAAIILVVLLRAGFNFGETVLSTTVGQSIIADLQRDMVRSMAALDLERLNRVHSGHFISNLLYDASLLRDAVVRGVASIAKEGLSLLLLGSVMLYQDWRLSAIAVLALPIIAWVTRALGRTTQKASVKGMAETGELTAALSEMLDGRRIVKAYGLEQQAVERADRRIQKRVHHLIRATKARAASAPASDFFGGLAMACAILYAGYEGMAGRLELNQFASFVGAMLLAQTPVRALSQLWTTVKEGLGAAHRVFALIDTKPTIFDAPNAAVLKIGRAPFGGSVRFENVSFAYHPGAEALDDFTFDVPAGKKIALVGPSGAGKSTVFNLLLRFYDVAAGRITIDGQDIRAVTLESMRANLALVTSGTVPVRRHRSGPISAVDVKARAQTISSPRPRPPRRTTSSAIFPRAIETRVGEGGLRLSGGQRQRIAIARAMLRDAPILLLDEATSALDSENERQVQEALKRLMKGRTTIVIAHRLTTVLDADAICVLDHGRIVESGTHGELMAKNGLYSRLYQHELRDEAAPAANLG